VKRKRGRPPPARKVGGRSRRNGGDFGGTEAAHDDDEDPNGGEGQSEAGAEDVATPLAAAAAKAGAAAAAAWRGTEGYTSSGQSAWADPPPLVGARDSEGPSPGIIYDVHAAHDAVAAAAASDCLSLGGEIIDAAAGDGIPRLSLGFESDFGAYVDVLPPVCRARSIQIPRTFSPRGEPPQPGARRARKMWTSLLTQSASDIGVRDDDDNNGGGDRGDRGDRGDGEGGVGGGGGGGGGCGSGGGGGVSGGGGQDMDIVKGVRYCHGFTHRNLCRATPCAFPHLMIDEVLAMGAADTSGGGGDGVRGGGGSGSSMMSSVKRGAYSSLSGGGGYGGVAASVPGVGSLSLPGAGRAARSSAPWANQTPSTAGGGWANW